MDQIPGYETMFSTGRRILNITDKSIRTRGPSDIIKHLDVWVGQALKALAALHGAGLAHTSLDVDALRVQGETLRLGSLEHVVKIDAATAAATAAPSCGTFDARNLIYPPERHFWCGSAEGLTFGQMFEVLDAESPTMIQITYMFPALAYSRRELRDVYDDVMKVKAKGLDWQSGDVWMLGMALMTIYSDILGSWPYVLSSEFYRTRHEQFMTMLEHMLHADPKHRWSAPKLLEYWWGSKEEASAAEEAVVEETNNADPATDAETTADVSGAVATVAAESSTPLPRRRRLFLNVSRDPSGRSRTRRMTRNSNPIPSNGNHD
jgi:hypothetical protein